MQSRNSGEIIVISPRQRHKDSERVVGSWQTREGRGEDATKSPLQMLPFSQRLCHACTARVLRSWRCYDACLTTFATPPRSHRVPGQIADPLRLF